MVMIAARGGDLAKRPRRYTKIRTVDHPLLPKLAYTFSGIIQLGQKLVKGRRTNTRRLMHLLQCSFDHGVIRFNL
jgi:hypothetical protein